MTALDSPVVDNPVLDNPVMNNSVLGNPVLDGPRRTLPLLRPLSFALPPELEAPSPPEARGMTRDSVRMLVAHKGNGSLIHSHFSELPRFLNEGDLVVLLRNTDTKAAHLALRRSGLTSSVIENERVRIAVARPVDFVSPAVCASPALSAARPHHEDALAG